MNDDVGADPARMDQLASALENLRDVLAANVPIIVNGMNEYWQAGTGSPISLQALQQALTRSTDDAADIRARAEMAAAWERKAYDCLPGGMISIPWDLSQEDLDADSARAAAQDLAAAEAESARNPKAARAQIEAIGADIQDHLDMGSQGTPWLQAFYDDAPSSVANLALVLHNQDASDLENENDVFTVLSDADQRILAMFGKGLAAADKAGISAAAVQAIISAASPWSAAMLIKYGPNGTEYATREIDPVTGEENASSLLAQMTDKIYKDQGNGELQIPIGDGLPFNGEDFSKYQDATARFEPLTPLLLADAQNINASWQVLGGPDGNGIAKQLLSDGPIPGAGNIVYSYPSHLSGSIPTDVVALPARGRRPDDLMTFNNTVPSSVVAEFLNAATSAGRGGSAANELSARAAAYVIVNTPPAWFYAGAPQPSFGPDIEQALTNVFLRYLPDIAQTAYGQGGLPDGDPDIYRLTDPNDNRPITGYMFTLPQSSLANFLQQLSSEPQNYGLIKGAAATAAGNALAMQLKNSGQTGADYYRYFLSLYGTLIQENGNLKYKGGQMLDSINAQLNAEIAFGENFVKDIPVAGNAAIAALTWDQQMAGLGLPQVPQFSTDNAVNALKSSQQAIIDAEINADIPIIQGLAQNHVTVYVDIDGQQVAEDLADVGSKQHWYQNGTVVDNAAFRQWWGGTTNGTVQDLSQKGGQYNSLDYYLGDWREWMEQAASETSTTGP